MNEENLLQNTLIEQSGLPHLNILATCLAVLEITFDNRTLSGQYTECLNKFLFIRTNCPDKLSRQIVQTNCPDKRFSEDTANNGCRGTKNRVVVKKTVNKFVSEMIKVFR